MHTTVFARVLYDGRERREGVLVRMEDDRIAEVREGTEEQADLSGVVTPGFIDAHSHIGMIRQGEPQSEADVNDQID
ncbi:MAG: imidazolonepropionase, partial [Spirochaetota bacterium]